MNRSELAKNLGDWKWRIRNLYWILNKIGQPEKFKPNEEQEEVIEDLHENNVVLKARQRGISTLAEILILDYALFEENKECGIVDATLPDAVKKLKKCKFAYEHIGKERFEEENVLNKLLKETVPLIKDNEQEMSFGNGSTITADTTYGGSTVQFLHISELAKICAESPIKATEIRTGALNAIGKGLRVIIESTAMGSDGDFYEICQRAEKLQKTGKKLTSMDYKFFFFPWWRAKEYRLSEVESALVTISQEDEEYFNDLEKLEKVTIDKGQRAWYVKKREMQGEEMKREYPSTSKECFEVSEESKYYKKWIIKAAGENRITEFQIEKGVPVDTSWDFGINDMTCIVFWQKVGKEYRVVDYLENSGEELGFYVEEMKKRGYLYGRHWLPHDAATRSLQTGLTYYEQLEKHFGGMCRIVDAVPEEAGINEVRRQLGNVWFRSSTTDKLVEHLEKFSKKFSRLVGHYTGPLHDEHNDAADAFKTYFLGMKDDGRQGVRVIKRVKRFVNSLTGF